MENNHRFFLVLGALIGFGAVMIVGYLLDNDSVIVVRNAAIGSLVGFWMMKGLINCVQSSINDSQQKTKLVEEVSESKPPRHDNPSF